MSLRNLAFRYFGRGWPATKQAEQCNGMALNIASALGEEGRVEIEVWDKGEDMRKKVEETPHGELFKHTGKLLRLDVNGDACGVEFSSKVNTVGTVSEPLPLGSVVVTESELLILLKDFEKGFPVACDHVGQVVGGWKALKLVRDTHLNAVLFVTKVETWEKVRRYATWQEEVEAKFKK